MKTDRITAVVFDMDGVIFDTERIVLDGWKNVAKKHHITDIEKIYHKCFGVNSDTTKKIFLDEYGEDFPYDNYCKEAVQYFYDQYDEDKGLPVMKGAVELLQFLQQKGVIVGLASSTKYQFVKKEMDDAGLTGYFKVLTCGDMVTKSKPEPDIYLKACENLGVKPEQAIAIEDSYNGIRAAYKAGLTPIMVPDQMEPNEEMVKLSAHIFHDLLDCRKWIEDIL